MLTLPDTQPHGEPQVVSMSEDADTLDALLRICYPMEHPISNTLDKLWPVIAAAKKYEIQFATITLRQSLRAFLRTEPPLRMYAVACLCRLPDIARESARLLLDNPHYMELDPEPPELWKLSTEHLLVLAAYRRRCRKATLAVVDDKEWLVSGDYRTAVSKASNPKLASSWIWLSCSTCPAVPEKEWAPAGEGGRSNFVYPRAWWTRYIARVRELLDQCPTANSAMNVCIEPFVGEAQSCRQHCSSRAREQLIEFRRLLRERVERAVGEVRTSWTVNVARSLTRMPHRLR